jgi:Late exocytosis, associated with Golgi transport
MTKRRNVFSAAFETAAAATVAASTPPQGDGDDLWWWDESESEFRILQDETPPDNSTDDSGLATPATADGTNDSVVLRQTFLVYGTALLFVVLLFCWVRLKFPRVYNLRSGWVEALKRSTESPPQQTLSPLPDSSSSSPEPEVSQLAQNQHQFVSWIWKLYMITDDELVHECGMDALCLVRIIHMGYRLRYVRYILLGHYLRVTCNVWTRALFNGIF